MSNTFGIVRDKAGPGSFLSFLFFSFIINICSGAERSASLFISDVACRTKFFWKMSRKVYEMWFELMELLFVVRRSPYPRTHQVQKKKQAVAAMCVGVVAVVVDIVLFGNKSVFPILVIREIVSSLLSFDGETLGSIYFYFYHYQSIEPAFGQTQIAFIDILFAILSNEDRTIPC